MQNECVVWNVKFGTIFDCYLNDVNFLRKDAQAIVNNDWNKLGQVVCFSHIKPPTHVWNTADSQVPYHYRGELIKKNFNLKLIFQCTINSFVRISASISYEVTLDGTNYLYQSQFEHIKAKLQNTQM